MPYRVRARIAKSRRHPLTFLTVLNRGTVGGPAAFSAEERLEILERWPDHAVTLASWTDPFLPDPDDLRQIPTDRSD